MLWSQRRLNNLVNVVLFRSTYVLFLHLYDGLVVVIKPKLAKVTRGNITWASQVGRRVPATNECFIIEEEKHNNIVPSGKLVHRSVSSSPISQPQARTRAHTMTSVLILSLLEIVIKQWERILWRQQVCEESGRWPHLDCQGVITPSSGPPINTSFLILRKFFFHSEIEVWKCTVGTLSWSVPRCLCTSNYSSALYRC